MKYLCLVYEEEAIFHRMSREEWDALREETLAYVAELQDREVLLDARPLRSATSAVTVRMRSRSAIVTDGPFAETKEQIGGYFLIEVDSHEHAVEVASRWPGARLGRIEVRPVDEELREDKRY